VRILFLIPTLGAGGAERVVSILANELSKEYEVSIFCIENEKEKGYVINENVDIESSVTITRRGKKCLAVYDYLSSFTKKYREVDNYIEKTETDIIISFLPKADVIAYTIAKKRHIPWISSERNDPWVRNCLERKFLERIYKKCDYLVCQTKRVKKHYKERGVLGSVEIPNPVTQYKVSPDKDYQKIYGRYCLAIGRLDTQKNYDMLIESFSQSLKNTKKKYKLIILGEGSQREHLQEMIDYLSLRDEVLLLGKTNNVQDYISTASFYVMSSDYEGMPNALLEAMNGGLPVICTDIQTGAARELIDNSNGRVVPVKDTTGMTNAISEMMLISDEKRKEMGESSHRRLKMLREEYIVGKWNKLIKKTVQK